MVEAERPADGLLTGLQDELVLARSEFLAALGDVAPELLTTPGIVGEWSARDLLAHVGYWAGHAVEVIHAVEQGRADQVGDELSVDERNEIVVRVARETDLATVRLREAASFDALLDRVRGLDPSLLQARLPDGATLETGIREDGPEHYREHELDLRSWFSGPDEASDDDADADAEDEAADGDDAA